MQMPATEGRLGTEAADQRDPDRHAGARRGSARVAARRRRRDQGQRRYVPAARGVAGLSADRVGCAVADARPTTPSTSRFAGSGSPSGRPEPSTTSRSPSAPARSTRSSARTAPASRRSARSSPGSSRRTRATWSCGGRRSRSARPREALVRGIALVAQEVALVPRLTVAQNVFLGAEPRRAGFIDRRVAARAVRPAGRGRRASTSRRARSSGGLPLAQQQQVEILRALAREADLIVLDEPTGQPVGDGDRAAPRDRPRPAGARPDGHPRLAFPRRGPRPGRHRHGPARRPRRPDRARPPTRPRPASSPGCSAGRSAGPIRTSGSPPPEAPSRSSIDGLSAPGRRRTSR